MLGGILEKACQRRSQNQCSHYGVSACILFIISGHNVSDLTRGEATRGTWRPGLQFYLHQLLGFPVAQRLRICLQFRRCRRCASPDPWAGKICWRGHGNPLQCSCLENPVDRGAWWATVPGVTGSQTRLQRLSTLMLAVTDPGLWEKSLDFPVSVSWGLQS